jgi:predicted Zn-dependent peptidase
MARRSPDALAPGAGPQRAGARRGAVLAAVAIAAATALPALPAQAEPVDFRTPDGTRFVLVVDASMPQVHWAVASHAGCAWEPVGLEGLARTTVALSLHGTWRTGSRDAEREQQALADLDEAMQRLVRDPADVAVALRVRQLDELANGYADVAVFPRVLAAAPAFGTEVRERGDAAVLVLTTVPAAIGKVARLLLERREEQPLRSLAPAWLETLAARTRAYGADPRDAARAEVLALALPDHPANRAFLRPQSVAPTRDQALAVWAATQRPERTVHVLVGGFDAAAARAALTATFAATRLPVVAAPAPASARPLAGTRRSTIRGDAAALVAWLLPPGADRATLAATAHWLGGGADSVLAGALARAGHAGVSVHATAPWPAAGDGSALLLVEVRAAAGAAGADGLADVVLGACRAAAASAPDAAAVQSAVASLQREWRASTADPRELAARLAADALCWPQRPVAADSPDDVDAAALQRLLAATVAGHPVVVEVAP